MHFFANNQKVFTRFFDFRFINRCFIKKVLIITLSILTLFYIFEQNYTLVENSTASLPYRFFLLKKKGIPKKHAFVLFKNERFGVLMVKQVKGVEGSVLKFDAQRRLWVDDFCIGLCIDHMKDGSKLTPIKEGIVPKGYVFVYAYHTRSFDSRYAEMGLVSVQSIKASGSIRL